MPRTDTLQASDFLQFNLVALSVRQPRLAERLAAIDIPPGVERAEGRDGTPSYHLPESDGAWHWLGRTSMPRVRAEALIEGLGDDGGNVLVSPMGTGMEALVRLERTANHCAVFVYDSDPAAMRLALTLRDVGDALRDGRLVLLTDADPGKAIHAFMREWPAYEFPHKLLAPPHVPRRDIEAMRQSMDLSAHDVVRMQSERVRDNAVALANRETMGGAGHRVAILTVDPRDDVIETATALRGTVGDSAIVNAPDRPERCHHLARIQALAEEAATSAVLLNCGWGALATYVPDDLPVATWLLPGSPMLKGMTDGFGPNHAVFAATPELCDQAVEAGVAQDRVQLLEIGCDDAVFRQDDGVGPTMDVVLVGDVADLRPEVFRIELASQVAIWKAICMETAKRL